MDSFCGSTFWDKNISWYTEDPELTPCFEKTVLVWIPCLFLWIFTPIEAYYLYSSKYKDVPWNYLNISKFVLVVLIICHCIGDFVYVLMKKGNNLQVYSVDIYSPVIKFFSFCLAAVLLSYNRKKGQRSSGHTFLFYFLCTLCGAPQLRSIIRQALKDHELPDPIFISISYIIFYSATILSFLLNFFAEPEPNFSEYPAVKRLCPERGSSFLSKLTFSWFSPLAKQGYRAPLKHHHLWHLNFEDTSREVVPKFEKYWNALVHDKSLAFNKNASFLKQSGNISFQNNTNDFSRTKSRHVSILKPLCKAFGPTFIFGSFLKVIQDLLTFIHPQILRLLIVFVSGKESMWKGCLFAVVLLATATCQTLLLAQYFNRMSLVGLRIRTALISAIYRKALRVSNAARKESTVGEIVNLMSVDAQRFMDLTAYLNLIWSAPIQIALSVYFLWQILGPSVLAGLAVMIILIPFNAWVASKVRTLQIKQMKCKDERVKLMNEILSGIKVLKLYAWEPSYEQQVLNIRQKEAKILKHTAYFNSFTYAFWVFAPFIISLVTFAVFVLSDPNNILDSETAFVSLSLFFILRFPLSMLPMLISNLVQTLVSVKRINKFMNLEELDPNCVQHSQAESDPVVVENGAFSWGGNQKEDVVLRNINIRVKQASLVAVVGTVGSGKSSLLSAILGEMEKVSGRVNTTGSIAYVPQQAWIQNATLKDNILFGRNHEQSNYTKIIRACALQSDLEMLPAGDSTEIGEKGVNLSGGQKQRVSLARAVYSNSDLYMLDDPLSAVDSHVGKHIFDNVIGPKGLLKKKTRVLVTHSVTYLPEVDLIIVVKDGQISESGTYKQLLDQKGAFAEFLIQYQQEEEQASEITGLDEASISKILDQDIPRRSSQESISSSHSLHRRRSSGESKQYEVPVTLPGELLVEEEKMETGNVKIQIYLHYIKSIGAILVIAILVLNISFQVFSVGANIWLSHWSSDNSIVVNGTHDRPKQNFYLYVYTAFGIGQCVVEFFADILLRLGMLVANQRLHSFILHAVLFAPLTFTDTTPIGRILSRFSKDIDVIDNQLPWEISDMLFCFFEVVATLSVISFTTPIFIAIILPIGIFYFFVQRYYVATSRQLKRLESVSRSPIYSHFGETITGAASIRAYGVQERFVSESEKRVDHNQICLFPSLISNRWLAIRLEMVGNFIIFFSALFAVMGRDTVNAGLVGLSVTYALQITQTLNWLVRMASDVETNIVAVERIKEYGETPQEAAWEVSPSPPTSWPDKGQVEFQHYQVRYRQGLDLVLKGISFTVKGGEKVGIVGRTGAGKSSLTLCLFRILEAAGGQIIIDNQDISKLGLGQLRSRLTIIPQDPVLFSGTLRMNLDPFNRESDGDVWHALELAHLKNFVKDVSSGLQHQVTEGGDNLSVGQRQLICLSRALLRKTKLLILDEATAAVDLETDDLIQQTIRSQFRDCTVLTIAHRLNTIMDYDRVLVLEKGLIVEFDSPANLLKKTTSVFYGMAKDANLV